MNRQAATARFRTCALALAALVVACSDSVAQTLDGGTTQDGGTVQDGGLPPDGGTPQPTAYNPYPPGILPADLASELLRVQHEIGVIFEQARAAWLALPTPNVTGQPPTVQGTGYQQIQTLGKLMNFDLNMSPFRDVACASCHMPYAGFSGPIPSVNLTMIAYPGSFRFRAGKRTAQRYTYSPRFPVMELYPAQQLLVGGNFWDGRST